MTNTASFRFEYDPGAIVYGRDAVADLDTELANHGVDRALVITGETVGTTAAVIEPVREGLGDRCADVFAETTPKKRLTTAFEAANRLREEDADTLVSLGGGSSLDIATVVSILAVDDRSEERIRTAFKETGTITPPSADLPPVFAVPTTLAGADLSVAAGVTDRTDGVIHGGVFGAQFMPTALFYDPALIETTPHDILCASAMNGFDKGIESLYARNATPVTDATASRGLSYLSRGLARLGAGDRDEQTLHDVVIGTMLVQYGASRGDGTTLSLIHAFGHGITRGYSIQQGSAHGIIAPHALDFLFDHVDGRRDLLADALGVTASDDPATTAKAVSDAVAEIRDALGLPSRLRSVNNLSKDDLPAIAATVATDSFISNVPPALDTSEAALEDVLHDAW